MESTTDIPPDAMFSTEVLGIVDERGRSTRQELLNVLMRPTPAEAPYLNGRIERATDIFQEHFHGVNNEAHITARGVPTIWKEIVANTGNQHRRCTGVAPYQHASWRSVSAQTSLTETTKVHGRLSRPYARHD